MQKPAASNTMPPVRPEATPPTNPIAPTNNQIVTPKPIDNVSPAASPASTSFNPFLPDSPVNTPSTGPLDNQPFAINTQPPKPDQLFNSPPELTNNYNFPSSTPSFGAAGQLPPTPNFYNQPPLQTPPNLITSYQQANNYYNSNLYSSLAPSPAAYNPYATPANTIPENVTRLHPLLKGVVGLPYEFYLHPNEWYSYVSTENRVSVVKLAGYGQRISAMLIDSLVLLIPNFILLMLLLASLAPSIRQGNSNSVQTDIPIWFWLGAYMLNLGYLWFGTAGGSTLGKRAVHIKVRLLDGSRPGWFLALLREFSGYLLSASAGIISFIILDLLGVIVAGSSPGGYNSANTSRLVLLGFLLLIGGSSIGYLWPLWDRQKQAWHDKLARTLVTEAAVWVEGVNFGLPPRQPEPTQNVAAPANTAFNSAETPYYFR